MSLIHGLQDCHGCWMSLIHGSQGLPRVLDEPHPWPRLWCVEPYFPICGVKRQ